MITLDHKLRFGRFTSSKIGDLMAKSKDGGFGTPAMKYINQVRKEINLGRKLNTAKSAKPLEWGTVCEFRVQKLLKPQGYEDMHNTTIQHDTIERWAGTPDAFKDGNTVVEIKCPYTLESFCDLVDSFEKGGISELRKVHSEGEKYYWQCVSNAVLTGVNHCELIVYCPYEEELVEITSDAALYGFQWLVFAEMETLPYIIFGGKYKNINVLSFDIPEEDIELLTNTIIKANEFL